jgi:hypothetical protein
MGFPCPSLGGKGAPLVELKGEREGRGWVFCV